MATTVIDSLIVQLGLDPSGFTKGQKDAAAALVKTKQDATRTAKELEERGKQAGRFFEQVGHAVVDVRTKIAALIGTLLGAHALKDFLSELEHFNAALGRTAVVIGMPVKDLSNWQRAGRIVGAAAGEVTDMFRNLQQEVGTAQAGGGFGSALTALQQFTSFVGDQRAFGDIMAGRYGKGMTEVADDLKRLNEMNHALAANQARALHIPEQMIPIYLQGSDAVRKLLESTKQYSTTLADTTAAGKWQAAQQRMTEAWEKLGTSLDTAITPAVVKFFNAIEVIADDIQNSGIIQWFGDWTKANPGLAASIGTVTAAVLSLKAALFGLSAIKGIGKLLGLGGEAAAAEKAAGAAAAEEAAGGTAAGGSGALAWLGPLGAFLGTMFYSSGTNQGEDAYMRAHPEKYPAMSNTGGMSEAEAEAYIRQEALKLGINPDIAVAVAKSEGLGRAYVGDRGSSFGPYQLHMGGLASGGMAVSGLGDEFRRKTGLDPRDPATERAQIRFSLQYASEHGWSPWHGFKGLPYAGISHAMAGAASVAHNTVVNNTTSNTHDVDLHNVHIHTHATDAQGIARDLHGALRREALVSQGNGGPT